MSSPADDARADLAFLRGIAEGGGNLNRGFGQAYFIAGLIYGFQIILHAGQFIGWVPDGGMWGLVVGLGPTAVFLPVIAYVNWRARKSGPVAATHKAVAAVFAGVGLSYFALIAVVGLVALQLHNFTVWLIYPCAVCVLQGAAWFVAFALRRHIWLLAVALAWIGFGVGLSMLVQNLPAFVFVMGMAMLICMVIPGAVMMNLARRNP